MKASMEAVAAWVAPMKANVLFLLLSTQLLLSDSSPLNQESRGDSSTCAKGWIHYERFCVTQAKGESDSAVAFYCDGFGGVGINGYCITKAHNAIASDGTSNGLGNDLWRSAAHEAVQEESTNLGDLMGASDEDASQQRQENVIEEIVCPKGWTHYGKICVYQPMTPKEQCHLLNAVSFSGLCLKHADMDAIEKSRLKYSDLRKAKRVCCCAHIKAKPNGYGCV